MQPSRWLQTINRYVAVPTGQPVNLAVFRIVCFLTLWWHVNPERLAMYAALPPELIVPPWGLGWTGPWRLPSPPTVEALATLLRVAALAAAFGIGTRGAAWLAACLSLFLLGIPNFFGKVNHSTPFLVWFAFILAASPSARALSVDALIRRARFGPSPPPSDGEKAACQAATASVWILLGLIYLFPGLWKLVTGNLAWVSGDILESQLILRKLRGTTAPSLDWLPSKPLLGLGATAVALFEIAFLPLVFSRFRPVAVAAGLSFHFATRALMGISFPFLQLMYAAMIDWDGLFRAVILRRGRASPPALVPRVSVQSTLASWKKLGSVQRAVMGTLVLGMALTGASKRMNAWPVSCFPAFDQTAGVSFRKLVVEYRDVDGATREVDLWQRKTVGLLLDLGKLEALERRVTRRGLNEAALHAFLRLARRHTPALAQAKAVRVYGVEQYFDRSVGAEPTRRLLWEGAGMPDSPALRASHLGINRLR